MTGTRQHDSLTSRIRQFFVDNPDEELTHADLIAKFGCGRKNAENSLKRLRDSGLLESVHITRLRTKGIASDPQPSRGADETRQTEEETSP